MADTLALIGLEVLGGGAEYAAVLVLLHNDSFAFHRNLYTVTGVNFQAAAHLLGDDDTA